MNQVEIMLKEYETLRQEILMAMNNRINILQFGITVIGAIFTVTVATYNKQSSLLLANLIFAVVIPSICIFVLLMWFGECQRIKRAGKFLVELEKQINQKISQQVLKWETELEQKRSHMKYPHNATVLLLCFISIFSQIIGLTNIGLSLAHTLILSILIHLILYTPYILGIYSLLSKMQDNIIRCFRKS